MQFCDAGETQNVKCAHIIVPPLPHPVGTENPSLRPPRRQPRHRPRSPGWFCSQMEPCALRVISGGGAAPGARSRRRLGPSVARLSAVSHAAAGESLPAGRASHPRGCCVFQGGSARLAPRTGAWATGWTGPQPQRSTPPAARVSVRAQPPSRVRAQALRGLGEPASRRRGFCLTCNRRIRRTNEAERLPTDLSVFR